MPRLDPLIRISVGVAWASSWGFKAPQVNLMSSQGLEAAMESSGFQGLENHPGGLGKHIAEPAPRVSDSAEMRLENSHF